VNEAVIVSKHTSWSRAERELYAGATCRVMGETDRQGRLLVELLSGPLAGCRRWMSEEEIRRTDAGNDCVEGTDER